MRFNAVVGGVGMCTVVHGSIAVVTLSGVITPRSLGEVKQTVLLMLADVGPVLGFLVHFERSTVRCSAANLTAILESKSQGDQATVPAAMVVAPDQLPLFREHVWQCAWLGVVRQAFTDAAQARRWLTARAEVAAQTRANHWQAI